MHPVLSLRSSEKTWSEWTTKTQKRIYEPARGQEYLQACAPECVSGEISKEITHQFYHIASPGTEAGVRTDLRHLTVIEHTDHGPFDGKHETHEKRLMNIQQQK